MILGSSPTEQDTRLWMNSESSDTLGLGKPKNLWDVELTKKAEIELSLAKDHLREAISLYANKEMRAHKHLDDAKEHYSNVLLLSEDFISSHYGLFKVAVLEKNYPDAFLQLQAYDRKLRNGSNFRLIYQMLMVLLGQKEELREASTNYIQDVKVDYGPLLDNYHLAETAFDKGDFQRVIKHLSICDNLAIKKGFDIDFSIMIHLANAVLVLCKEDKKKHLRGAFCSSNDVGEKMMIVHRLLELDATDFKSNFLYMDAYIDLKAYNPLVECIENLKKLPATIEEQGFLALYERLISEIRLESRHLKKIHDTLRKGELLKQEALYEEAISCYEQVHANIPFPYFQIKEAEAYYAMGDLEKAIDKCDSYLKSGYLHYVDASILLYSIYRKKGESARACDVAFESYQKTRMKERGISFQDWLTRLNNGYDVDDKGEMGDSPKQYLFQGISGK